MGHRGCCMRLKPHWFVGKVRRGTRSGTRVGACASRGYGMRGAGRGGMRRGVGVAHWAAPFVLAMLMLRAFIPAGFMLEPVDGRLEIVLCDSDASGAMLHPAGHDHGGHGHAGHEHVGHHQHTHPDPTCPYAQSAGPAPLPTLPALAPALEASLSVLPEHVAQTHARFGPTREQSSRGPPALA